MGEVEHDGLVMKTALVSLKLMSFFFILNNH